MIQKNLLFFIFLGLKVVGSLVMKVKVYVSFIFFIITLASFTFQSLDSNDNSSRFNTSSRRSSVKGPHRGFYESLIGAAPTTPTYKNFDELTDENDDVFGEGERLNFDTQDSENSLYRPKSPRRRKFEKSSPHRRGVSQNGGKVDDRRPMKSPKKSVFQQQARKSEVCFLFVSLWDIFN